MHLLYILYLQNLVQIYHSIMQNSTYLHLMFLSISVAEALI